jgi:hypothetical protein
VLLHETTGLRRYDAAVLSLTHMDFALGSAVRLPGTTEQGLTVQLPPLVKTEALWSLGEESGKKTLLLGVRFYKNDHFAETGLGQRQGDRSKKSTLFLQESSPPVHQRPSSALVRKPSLLCHFMVNEHLSRLARDKHVES